MEDPLNKTMPPSPAEDLTGTRVDRYEIRSRLGAGGMGEVYLAEDTKLKRAVALKRLAAPLRSNPRSHMRFLREAQRASALNHPHIAAVYDVREEKGETFLVLEYVEGITLRQRLREPIGVEEALRIATQCAEALGAAHEKGIAHHDIKPENIMLTPSGAVKVLDFGVAKGFSVPDQNAPTQSFEPVTHSLSGTPAYMAPEVLLEKEADGRADIFSLGVVLYELLTRQHPFLAGSLMGTSNRILNENPVPVTQLNPQIPPELGRVVEQMLAKDPAQRYAGAADLLRDLQAVQSGEVPARLRPPPRPASRVHRQALAAAAVFALLLLLAAAIPSFRVALGRGAQALIRLVSRPPNFTERGRVLVADFENRTGEAVFDQVLPELVTTTLEQSRYLNLFPSSQLPEVLLRMKRPATSRLDEATGLEICRREGLQALVLGSVARIGDDYLLTLRALNSEGRSLFSGQETARGQKAVVPVLDKLAVQLREQLGESVEAIRKSAEPLESVTSGRLEAVRNYSLGKKELYAGHYGQAEKLLQHAVELDQDFAMAYAYLAVVRFHQEHDLDGQEYLRKAVELSTHLTERERYKILGDYNLLVTCDATQAIDNYRVLLDLYPSDYGARINLSLAYREAGRFDQAVAETEAVLRQLDTPGLRENLAAFHFLAGRTDRAIEISETNLAAHPEDGLVLFDLGQFHMMKGEARRAVQYYQQLVGLGDAVYGEQAHQGLADLYWSQGRYRLALGELESARHAAQQRGDTPAQARTGLQVGFLLLERNDRTGAREEALRATAAAQEAGLLALAGSLLVQTGDLSASRALLRKLEAARAERWAVPLRAELQLAEGKAAAALQTLQQPTVYTFQTLALEIQARAHWAAHELPAAASAYNQVLARQAERAFGAADEPAFHRVVELYYRLGVLTDEQGNKTQAQHTLERFLSYSWDADADAPFVSDARRRLQRLAPKGTGLTPDEKSAAAETVAR